MSKESAELTGVVKITIAPNPDGKSSKLSQVDFLLKLGENLDVPIYLDERGLPNAVGAKALTQCFVQGLSGNIQAAHQKGYWDSAEHLRYAISELERAFAQVVSVDEGVMKEV